MGEMDVVCIGPANVEIPFLRSLLNVVGEDTSLDRLPEGKHNLATFSRSPAVERDEYVLTIGGEKRTPIRFTAPSKVECKPAGSALNIAVGFRRVGASVRLITSLVNVPHDLLSSDIRLYALRHGIQLVEVNRPMTPITFIIVDGDDECEKSTVLSYKPWYKITQDDANDALRKIKKSRATHMFATGIRIPELTLVRKAFRRARRRGIMTCFIPNPSILSPSDKDIRRQLEKVIPLVDILQINEREAEIFLEREEGALSFPSDIERIAKQTAVPTLIVTRGVKGAVAVIRGQYREIEAYQATPKVVDTTGAGDAFLLGFVFALHEGCTITDALSLAAFSATSNIMAIGGHGGMPSRDQLLRHLSQLRPKDAP
ncbi:MAG: carbohydrate kinase family protein [bacterium]|nr:carbohydrate kinase family protein [bacterium]